MFETTDIDTDQPVENDETAQLLAGIDAMSSRRSVAAQIVTATSSERADAKELAGLLMGDARLAGRVMKLANSVPYGMSGRATSLQFGITVVGFAAVRTLATMSLTGSNEGSALPDGFWDLGTGLALAASRLAPRFAEFPPDAVCLGLLSQIGAALLHHHDPAGYAALVSAVPDVSRRRGTERRRYGMSSVELSACALERWNFPAAMVLPLQRVDDRTSLKGGLLRASVEVVARLTVPDRERVPIGLITCGVLEEPDLTGVAYDVRIQMTSMRGLFADD